jgi:hypothetical protein
MDADAAHALTGLLSMGFLGNVRTGEMGDLQELVYSRFLPGGIVDIVKVWSADQAFATRAIGATTEGSPSPVTEEFEGSVIEVCEKVKGWPRLVVAGTLDGPK